MRSVRFRIYAVLLLVNTGILAVSAHINNFQKFFYRADVFPFALSLLTMAFVVTMILMDVKFKNSVTARPPFELGWLLVFGMLWLVCDAFSTSRWKFATPALCRTIPSDAQYAPYHTWCTELQALRILVWIEWIMFLCTFAYLLRWTLMQRNTGRQDIWSTAFSRFSAHAHSPPPPRSHDHHHRGATDSEFLQWEKFPREAAAVSTSTSTPRTEGDREFVGDDNDNDASQRQYERYLEPQYTHYSEFHYTQSPETQYTQSPHGLHPVAVPYIQHPQAQYTSPSQTQRTHYPQPYFSGPDGL